MNAPLVLAFWLSDERVAKLKTMCLLQKLRFRLVAPEEWDASLAALAGLEPMPLSTGAVGRMEEEMLVLCFFPELALNAFIAGFRKSSVPPISLKAVLTPTNAHWSAIALYAELKKERAAMSGA